MKPEFVRQTEQPLFPQTFWDRPTVRRRAGRLLLVGGQRQRFDLVQAVYQVAEAAGIGECQAVMPDSLRRVAGEAEFARLVPAAPSGSLGKAALGELLAIAPDFDALVIGLNLTNNAETAVMVESLVTELELPIVLTDEAIEAVKFHPALITGNPRALVVTTMAGLFALANHHHMPIAIKPGAGVVAKIAIVEQLAAMSACSYLVCDGEILVAADGQISLTPLAAELGQLPAAAIGVAATLWLQQRAKPFAGLTSAAFVLAEMLRSLDPPSTNLSYTQLTAAIRQTLKRLEAAAE